MTQVPITSIPYQTTHPTLVHVNQRLYPTGQSNVPNPLNVPHPTRIPHPLPITAVRRVINIDKKITPTANTFVHQPVSIPATTSPVDTGFQPQPFPGSTFHVIDVNRRNGGTHDPSQPWRVDCNKDSSRSNQFVVGIW